MWVFVHPFKETLASSRSWRYSSMFSSFIIIVLLFIFEHECESLSVVSDSLQLHGLYSPWNSPGQNTGVGSLTLLQGIFPTQESNPGLPECRQILYQLSHKGSPRREQCSFKFLSHYFKIWRFHEQIRIFSPSWK